MPALDVTPRLQQQAAGPVASASPGEKAFRQLKRFYTGGAGTPIAGEASRQVKAQATPVGKLYAAPQEQHGSTLAQPPGQ